MILAATLLFALPQTPADAPDIPADTEIQTTESGLKYSVLKAGAADGKRPKLTDEVTVHYTGWLTNGTKFDSSRDRGEPTSFKVGGVISGWTEGLQLMTVGSHFKLTIPADIGYGERGSPPVIPPNSTLIFEVELLKIVEGPPVPVFRAPNAEAQIATESGLKYEVLAAGEGTSPTPEEFFQLRYAFYTEDGELLEASAVTGQDLTASTRTMQLPFLKEAPLLMKPGTRLLCEVPASLAFGDQERGALKAGATSIWDIEMVRVFRVPEFSLSAEENQVTTESGLKYEVIREGNGERPEAGELVHAHYAGWLEDGTLFDSSYPRGDPLRFPVGQGRVIRGWDEGLMLMSPGAIYKFTIPAELGYGAGGSPPKIPGGATLVFWVELDKVGR